MHKGAYSLSRQVRNEMHLNALSGDVFIFIGGRHYMAAVSHERAQDAARMYWLLPPARLHNINPEKCLTYFFDNINGTPKDRLYQLLPLNYTSVVE